MFLRNKGVADPRVTCESMAADCAAPDELSCQSDVFIVAVFSQALRGVCAGFE